MKETSVLKGSATENFSSSWICNGTISVIHSYSPHPIRFAFSSAERLKRKGEGEKQERKENPLPRLQIQTEKGLLRCGWCQTPQLSWYGMFALQFTMRKFDVCLFLRSFLHFESMKRLKYKQKFDIFFASLGNSSYCLVSLDIINLNHQLSALLIM